jgi:ribosome maturation factor RimP
MGGEELIKLLEPAIEGLGYELSDLELKVGGLDGVVRIFIDKYPEGIDLEDCQAVSRQVSAILDVEDPIPGNYNLEVSSPGLDRRLKKIEHFQRFIGENVKIKLRFPQDGRRNYSGELKAAADDNIEVEVDGETHQLPIATIETARLIPTL